MFETVSQGIAVFQQAKAGYCERIEELLGQYGFALAIYGKGYLPPEIRRELRGRCQVLNGMADVLGLGPQERGLSTFFHFQP